MISKWTINSLISPVTVDEFFQNHWEKQFLYLKREPPGYYDSILQIDDLDRYLRSETLHPSFLRVVHSGKDSHPKHWTRIERRRNTDFYRVVDIDNLLSLFNAGATIILNSAERAIPGVTSFCNALEHELRIGLQTNIYVTPPNEEGFDVHHDLYDVLIMQISGVKHWRLYGFAKDPEQNKTSYADTSMMTVEHEFDMQPGDLLYLPKHLIHSAVCANEPSVHMTLGIHTRRWFHLVQHIAEAAEKSPDFQGSLPHQFSTEAEKNEFARQFTEKLQSLLISSDTLQLLAKENKRFVSEQLIDRSNHFGDLLRLEQITLDSVVAARAGIESTIERNGEKITIRFGHKELSVPRILGPSLESIRRAEPFAVREIKGLISDSGKIELTKNLIKLGFLAICSL